MVQESKLLQGYVQDFGSGNVLSSVWNSLKNGWKTALFMEALRNINWSRGYCWYVELDGVPSPFARGGVLGLPCKSVNFQLAQGHSLDWNNGGTPLSAPQSIPSTTSITLDVLDDEQGTLRQFFERWYNAVYNPYYGVLPLEEACKCITIYYQKSTRRNVKRVYYDIDKTLNLSASNFVQKIKDSLDYKSTEGMDFLVYPKDTIQLALDANQNDLISFTVSLEVALFMNQDFGDPSKHNGVSTIFNNVIGGVSDGNNWLDAIGDYI